MAIQDDIAALVIVFAPELTGDARIPAFVDIAIQVHAAQSPTWTASYTPAMAYYVAHCMTKAGDPANAGTGPGAGGSTGAAGAVASLKSGDEAISYGTTIAGLANLGTADAFLSTTTYGLAYLQLRDSLAYTGPGIL